MRPANGVIELFVVLTAITKRATLLASPLMKRGCLAAQIEALEELQITLVGGQLQVVQQFAATGDQLEQATTGGVILRVAGEVLGEVIDTLRQKCDLHVGTSGVFIVQLESAVADSGFAHGLVSVLASRRRVV